MALVSDAGTPGFSDPGADLVARAWEAGVRVEAIPGPAAGVAALSLSGFKGDILFVGFLPRGEGRRLKLLQALASEYRVIILYEAPKRLARTLTEIAGSMPRREVLVVRELTKKFEETWRGPVADIAREAAKTPRSGVNAPWCSPARRLRPWCRRRIWRPACSRPPGSAVYRDGAWRTGWPGTSRFPGDRSIRPTWP